MTIGSKSVLFGAHQLLIHPWFVAAACLMGSYVLGLLIVITLPARQHPRFSASSSIHIRDVSDDYITEIFRLNDTAPPK